MEEAIDKKITKIVGTTMLGSLKAALHSAIPIIEKRFEFFEKHLNIWVDAEAERISCLFVCIF